MKNKGITLVALVITIIILLILAGITISQLTGSGLFENARLAEEKYENAKEKEDETLADYENKIGEYIDGNRANASNEWKLWNSGEGYTSENNAMALPESYSELLIEVGRMDLTVQEAAYCYSFNIYKDMLLEDQYKLYAHGFSYSNRIMGANISVKKDSVYLRIYYHSNNDYLSTATMTVYYR